MTVIDLEIQGIAPGRDNRAAGGMDPERLKTLVSSIRAHGVLQPLLVRRSSIVGQPAGDAWELIAGHRRLEAARLAGLTHVPCSVIERRGLDNATADIMALVENLQRQDIHPLDEADGFARLETLGLTRSAIAEQVGCHRNHVAQRLLLTRLIDPLRSAWVEQPGLTVAAATAIAQLAPPLQDKYLRAQGDKLQREHAANVGYWAEANSDLLEHAPFDRADAGLVPAAGACSACPKRFGWEPELTFTDAPPGDPEERCGDRKCWRGKVKAHVARARERASANGVKLIDVTATGGESKDGPIPMHRIERYDEADGPSKRKSKPKAMLIVDGPEAGTVIDGWVRSKSPERDWAAERKKEQAEREAHIQERLPLLESIVDRLGDWSPESAVTRRVVMIAGSVPVQTTLCQLADNWRATSNLARQLIPDLELDEYGQVSREARERTEKLLDDMRPERRLLLLLAGNDLDRDNDGRGDSDMLTTIADMLGVDAAS